VCRVSQLRGLPTATRYGNDGFFSAVSTSLCCLIRWCISNRPQCPIVLSHQVALVDAVYHAQGMDKFICPKDTLQQSDQYSQWKQRNKSHSNRTEKSKWCIKCLD